MLGKRLWACLLRVDRASIEEVRVDEQRVTTDEGETIETSVVVSVRTRAAALRDLSASQPEVRQRGRATALAQPRCRLPALLPGGRHPTGDL